MDRIGRTFALVVTVVLIIACLAPASAAVADGPRAASVVAIVLSPYLTWQDIEAGTVPDLHGLARDGAIGNLNTRSRARGPVRTSVTEAALMLSAGSWAVEDQGAPGAYNLDEEWGTAEAAEAYRRFMGTTPGDAAIAYLGFPRAQRANDFDTLDTTLGSLGQAVSDAGGLTAAIGNSDAGFATRTIDHDRPAALVAMDERGLVDLGEVSRRLLTRDDDGPFGLSTDRERLAAEIDEVFDSIGAQDGPALVVIDPGDSHRAIEFAAMASPEVAEAHRLQALDTLDRVVGLVADAMPEDGVLIVVTLLPAEGDGPQGLTPAIVSGAGWTGYLTSSSTHRLGMATLTDVSATVLDVLDIERPVEMLGNAMTPGPSDETFEERVSVLVAADDTAVSIDAARVRVLNAFIITIVIILALTMLSVIRGGYSPRIGAVLRVMLLLVLAMPVASYLMFAIDPRPVGEWSAMGLLAVTTVLVWLSATALARTGRWVRPLSFIAILTATVIVLDPWIGSPLSLTGFLSYSPLGGARYYGIGNEGAGLLFGSFLTGVALLLDDHSGESWVPVFARWVFPVLGAFVVWTAAAPGLGANVGVAAWGVVCVAVAWAAMNSVRISWKLLLGVVVMIVVVVVALSWVDVVGEGSTHLARALDSAQRGGLGELWLIIARKVETNLRVLTHTNWTYVLVVLLGLFAYMRWKPRGEFREVVERFPYYSHALTALLVGGLVAYFTEDSGIIIPALMLVYPGVGVLYLMLSRERWGEGV